MGSVALVTGCLTTMAVIFAWFTSGGEALSCHCEGDFPTGICAKNGTCNMELAKACSTATHKATGQTYKFCDADPMQNWEGCREKTMPAGLPPPQGQYDYCRCTTDMCNGVAPGFIITFTTLTILAGIVVALGGAVRLF